MQIQQTVSLGVALVALVAITAGLGGWAGLGQSRAVLTATLRALVQLLAVGVVITAIFRTPVLAPLYLVVMVTAATWTSGRRLRRLRRAMPYAGLAIVAGAGSAALTIFACQALPFQVRTAVPLVAQLIGGAMNASTLSGQRFADDVGIRWEEVEGWLAIGATPRQAVLDLSRRAASRAVVPVLDQTRNVGLVVLPGAFVGLLLGGATPLEAGRLQVLVLVGLLAAQTVTGVVLTTLMSADLGRTRPPADV